MKAAGMSAAGQKKGIFGRVRAKAGQERCGNLFLELMGRVPAGSIDVMSLPVPNSDDIDHDLVIENPQT
jgi:hypothetical protein